jgi:NAD(P)-dependent dehydrogenase (short-subunit alcohol dehydrogenase family)
MGSELAGQVAIVTGGSRGIGRAVAQALAAAGAAVTVTGRARDQLAHSVALIEGAGGRALALAADVADSDAMAGVLAETERQLGPVDVLVNNAAIADPLGPLWEADPAVWWRTVETNLGGAFYACRAVLPGMVARRRGRIINVTGAGGIAPVPHFSAYGASKAALLRLTDTLAAEVASHGIRVFALSPGMVETQLGVQGMAAVRALAAAGDPTPFVQRAATLAAPWRPAADAGALCVRLASGQADGLSGRVVSVADDLDDLIKRTEAIEQQDLYTLRLRT